MTNDTKRATNAETEDNLRLKKTTQFVADCMNAEYQARAALRIAIDRTKRAREKYEALFNECEARAVARRKAGLIEVKAGY